MRGRLALVIVLALVPAASAWGTVFAFASSAPWVLVEVRWDGPRTVSVDVDYATEAANDPLGVLYLVEGDVDGYDGHARFVRAHAWTAPNWGGERLRVAAPGVETETTASLVTFVAPRAHGFADQEYGIQSVGWLRFLVLSTAAHTVAFDVRSTDAQVDVAVATGEAVATWGDRDEDAPVAVESHVAAYRAAQSTTRALDERFVGYFRADGATGRVVAPSGETRAYDPSTYQFLTAASPGDWTFGLGAGARTLDATDRVHLVGATVPATLGLAPAPSCDAGWTGNLCL